MEQHTEIEELEELEQEEQETYVLDVRKLRRRLIFTSVCTLLALITLFFPKYHDFDVIFKAIYNVRYEGYIAANNFGSFGFVVGFAIAILYTVFLWIFLYSKGSWQEKLNSKRLYDIYDIISIIPFFIALVTVLNAFILSPATVTRTSMEPNYYEGDNVFILHTKSYERYDVVIVLANESEYNENTGLYSRNEHYIKRIIGLPGETVTITGGEIYIDGELLDDPTRLKVGAGTYCNVGALQDETQSCTFTVPEGEYFLIGDNREASYDSRALGSFKLEDLFGKVIFKIG